MRLICIKDKMKRTYDISNSSFKDVELFSKTMSSDGWDIMVKGCVK